MSRLQELIARLCPEGVEYKRLDELFITKNGYTPSKKNTSFYKNGVVPWFRMEDIRESGRILSVAKQMVTKDALKGEMFPANSIIVATSATIGEHALITVPSIANQRFTYLVLREEYKQLVDMKFMYYYCFRLDEYCKKYVHQGNFLSVDMTKFVEFKIPVPPLAVQAEVVRLLDAFTALTQELTQELSLRKKQYEYYRDQLLIFNVHGGATGDLKVQTVDSIATVTKLAGFEFTQYVNYTDEGNIIALRGLNVKNGSLNLTDVKYIDGSELDKLSRSKLYVGDMLFTYVGTIGQVALVDEDDKYYFAPNVARIRFDENVVLPKYMLYYFQSSEFWRTQINRLLQSSSMKNLTMEKIRKFKVVIPSLAEQQRIVGILDKFDTLVNDLTAGLPAEIAARERQYAYYRDRLLAMPERQV